MNISMWTRSARTVGLGWALAAMLGWVAGCERRPTKTDEPIATATATAPDGSTEASSPQAADAEDDQAAPRALPRSSEVQGWIKTGAAKVGSADQAGDFVQDPALVSVLGNFKVQQLARAEYTSPHAKAVILMVQGQTTQDALGIFTVVNSGADCAPRDDGSLRVTRANDQQRVLTAWQGTDFIRIECSVELPEGVKGCERLLSRTIFGLPSAEPPLLMQAVKDVQQEHCQFWVVRAAAALAKQSTPRLQQIEPAALDARLGLNGSVLLSVVAVEQTKGAAPIIIWLAQYTSPEDAKAAAQRYAQALESENLKGLDSVTFVGSPKGVYLMGTWTADQQAAKEMVKLLQDVLPGE